MRGSPAAPVSRPCTRAAPRTGGGTAARSRCSPRCRQGKDPPLEQRFFRREKSGERGAAVVNASRCGSSAINRGEQSVNARRELSSMISALLLPPNSPSAS
jgi:hypothetical protein